MYMSKKIEPPIWCYRIRCNRIWYFRNSSIFYLRNSLTFFYIVVKPYLVYECTPDFFCTPRFFSSFFGIPRFFFSSKEFLYILSGTLLRRKIDWPLYEEWIPIPLLICYRLTHVYHSGEVCASQAFSKIVEFIAVVVSCLCTY